MTPSRFMLDTNIISDMVRNPSGSAARRARQVEGEICTSIIVAAELRYGCAKKGSPQLLRRVEALLDEIDILPFDIPADVDYGGLRAELEAEGQLIGANDLFIAAHAYSQRLILVTANVREFSRVRGLKVENWLE